jgi:hypothetical protein
LIGAMQTGDRLTHYPSTAFTELNALEQKLSSVPGAIEALRATENTPGFAKSGSDSGSDHSSFDQANARLAAYNSTIAAAMAHIADISVTKPQASLDQPSSESKMPER